MKDAHPWNVLFDGPNPVFIDWGSIEPLGPRANWPYEEFRDRSIPLHLMLADRGWIARRLMLDTVRRPSRGDVIQTSEPTNPLAFLASILVRGQTPHDGQPRLRRKLSVGTLQIRGQHSHKEHNVGLVRL